MKKQKQDISVRELFRRKLENAEICPDPSASIAIMSKLARKEFLRFNPARFNIYYLGSILVAGITAAVILTWNSKHSNQSFPSNPSNEIIIPAGRAVTNVEERQTLSQGNKKNDVSTAVSVRNNNKVITNSVPDTSKKPVSGFDIHENPPLSAARSTGSVGDCEILPVSTSGMDKLRENTVSESVTLETSETEGCAPLKVHFFNKSIPCDSCKWVFDDGKYSFSRNPEWIFNGEGEHRIILNVYNEKRLVATKSTIITVFPKPVAGFEIENKNPVIPEDEIQFFNLSRDGVHFNWNFGDGTTSELFEPRHKYSKFHNYAVSLIVSTDNGCTDTLVVANAFSGSGYSIEFPNAFIPNSQGPSGGYYSTKSDEAAHVFHPVYSGVSDFRMKIFSKLGILIFESNDINIGWDGYLKGELCKPGVYVWNVTGKFRNGEPFTKIGDVTLLGDGN